MLRCTAGPLSLDGEDDEEDRRREVGFAGVAVRPESEGIGRLEGGREEEDGVTAGVLVADFLLVAASEHERRSLLLGVRLSLCCDVDDVREPGANLSKLVREPDLAVAGVALSATSPLAKASARDAVVVDDNSASERDGVTVAVTVAVTEDA